MDEERTAPEAYSWSKDYTLQDLRDVIADENYTPDQFQQIWPRGFDMVLVNGEYVFMPPEENPYRKEMERFEEEERRKEEAYEKWLKERRRWVREV